MKKRLLAGVIFLFICCTAIAALANTNRETAKNITLTGIGTVQIFFSDDPPGAI